MPTISTSPSPNPFDDGAPPSSSSSSSSSSTSTFASAAASIAAPSSPVENTASHRPKSSSAVSSSSTATASAVTVPPQSSTTVTTDNNNNTPTTTDNTTTTTTNSNNRDSTSTPTNFSGSAVGSISRRNRRSLAAFAREKTSSALASLSFGDHPSNRSSSPTQPGSLPKHNYKQSQLGSGFSPLTPPLPDESSSAEQLNSVPSEFPANSTAPSTTDSRRQTLRQIPSEQQLDPEFGGPSQKMHQTSSRLLRMTEDDRPFTKVGN